jgi:hypothetical protein
MVVIKVSVYPYKRKKVSKEEGTVLEKKQKKEKGKTQVKSIINK